MFNLLQTDTLLVFLSFTASSALKNLPQTLVLTMVASGGLPVGRVLPGVTLTAPGIYAGRLSERKTFNVIFQIIDAVGHVISRRSKQLHQGASTSCCLHGKINTKFKRAYPEVVCQTSLVQFSFGVGAGEGVAEKVLRGSYY